MHSGSKRGSVLGRQQHRLARAIGLAALILFGLLAQTLHESTEAHAICPEHGELVHVDRAPAGAQSVAHGHALDACNGEDGPRVDPFAGPGSHDHCLLASMLRPGASPWIAAPVGWAPPVDDTRLHAVVAGVRFAAIPTLAFAPKHSPPARAA